MLIDMGEVISYGFNFGFVRFCLKQKIGSRHSYLRKYQVSQSVITGCNKVIVVLITGCGRILLGLSPASLVRARECLALDQQLVITKELLNLLNRPLLTLPPYSSQPTKIKRPRQTLPL